MLQSAEESENGKPLLLVQGTFTDRDSVTLTALAELPDTSAAEGWAFQVSGGEVRQLRILNTPGSDGQVPPVLIRSGDDWRTADSYADGSYLVVGVEEGDSAYCVVHSEAAGIPLPLVLGGCAVLVLAVFLLLKKKKK